MFTSKNNVCIVLFSDKSSQHIEQTHDKLHAPLILNNSEMTHRNARGSCHELNEVTSTLLHATVS